MLKKVTIDALRSMIDVNAAIDDRVNVPLVPGVRILYKLLVEYADSWDTPCRVCGLLGHLL